MTTKRFGRNRLFIAALLALALLSGVGTAMFAGRGTTSSELPVYDIGGDFRLTNQHGATMALSELRGNVVLLFFGYTHCPDICPATLARMKAIKNRLDADGSGSGDRFRGVLVSVDPARDTPERLREYIEFFDPSFTAFTGSLADLTTVAQQFGAYFSIPDAASASDKNYGVDHTGRGYLLDAEGRVRVLYDVDTDWQEMLAGVRALLSG